MLKGEVGENSNRGNIIGESKGRSQPGYNLSAAAQIECISRSWRNERCKLALNPARVNRSLVPSPDPFHHQVEPLAHAINNAPAKVEIEKVMARPWSSFRQESQSRIRMHEPAVTESRAER